ncbi:MAG: ankyrin repeat domain-containing protein, partial [Rhodanobacteraceae bacterium]
VIDGKIEMAGVWGPMAGYYKTIKKAPLVIQPVNLMDDVVPLEFDMAMAVPRGRPEVKAAIEKAMHDSKDQIHAILVEYGVPLVKCDDCIIDGDLPSHGPYKTAPPPVQSADANGEHRTDVADLKKWLAQGADPTEELGHAIIADDMERVTYLLDHKADPNARTGDGYTALGNAVRFGFTPIATLLVQRKADPNQTDLSGWTPLMYAVWSDQDEMVKLLLANGARTDVTKENDGLTPLAIAAQNDKKKSAPLLIEAGADVNHPVGKGAYTPLMLAATSSSVEIAKQLIAKGANINATNPGGVTALMIAAAGNRTEIATLLIEAGADPNLKSEDGRTALTIAQSTNSDAVVKLLQARQKGAGKSS